MSHHSLDGTDRWTRNSMLRCLDRAFFLALLLLSFIAGSVQAVEFGEEHELEKARDVDRLLEEAWKNSDLSDSTLVERGRWAIAEKTRVLGEDDPELAVTHFHLGQVLFLEGSIDASREEHLLGLEILEQSDSMDSPSESDFLIALGQLETRADDYDRAMEYLEQARILLQEHGLDDGEEGVQVEGALAALYRRTGDHEKSLSSYREAIRVTQDLHGEESAELAQLVNSMGVVFKDIGRYAESEAAHRRALEIRQRVLGPDHLMVARTMHGLAEPLRYQAKYASAESMLTRSRAIMEMQLPADHPYLGHSHVRTGNLMRNVGRYEEALEHHSKGMEIYRVRFGEGHSNLGYGHLNRAAVLNLLSDFEAAESDYWASVEIFTAIHGENHRNVSYPLVGLLDLYLDHGEVEKAVEVFAFAKRVMEASVPENDYRRSWIPQNACRLELMRGDFDAARIAIAEAYEIRREVLGEDNPLVLETLAWQAEVEAEYGDFALGQSLCDQAIERWELAHGTEDPELAFRYYVRSRIRRLQGDTDRAFDDALQAERIARLHLRLNARGLSEQKALIYAEAGADGLAQALALVGELDPNQIDRAWTALARSRGVVQEEMAWRRRFASLARSAEDSELLARYRAATSEEARITLLLADAPRDSILVLQQAEAEQQRELLESEVARRHRDFLNARQAEAIDSQLARARLPDGSALVSFANYHVKGSERSRTQDEEAYLAFVVLPDDPEIHAVELGSATEIEAAVRSWRGELDPRGGGRGVRRVRRNEGLDLDRYHQASRGLRQMVWDPIASLLAGRELILLVPAGVLHFVNFEALSTDNGLFLAEVGPLFHSLSTERSLVVVAEDRGTPSMLALGGARYDLEMTPAERPTTLALRQAPCESWAEFEFTDLPGSETEVREIQAIWAGQAMGSEVRVLIAEDATEEQFRNFAPGASVIHVATHGFFRGSDCRPSAAKSQNEILRWSSEGHGQSHPLQLTGIALSGANHRAESPRAENDGILSASEIATLDLDSVEWAVLSACETGLGELQDTEGVLGLRRAMEVAGVGTLVMSLWTVDDRSTREWMSELYQHRFERGESVPQAIRSSNLALLESRRSRHLDPHPWYWALFVATGEWQ